MPADDHQSARFSRSLFDDGTDQHRSVEPERRRTKPDRPLGLSILAALHVIGGILLFGAQFLLWSRYEEMQQPMQAIGIPPILLLVAIMFLSLLGIASGVGMWTGARWGWWAAAFYYIYGIFRNASALLALAEWAEHLEGSARGPGYYLVKHSGRIVVHALILLYLMKGNVLEFFDQESLNKAKALGSLVAICALISLFTSALSMLFG